MPQAPKKTSRDYFEVIFGCSFGQKKIDTSSKLWVFEHLFRDGFDQLTETIKLDFDRNSSIALSPEACQSLSNSLQARLKEIVGPTFQANYKGLVDRAEHKGLIPRQRTDVQEAEVQQWFLQTMQREGTARLFGRNVYLRQVVVHVIGQWTENCERFLQRLQQDLPAINRHAGPAIDGSDHKKITIKSLQCDLSDSHNGGETVRIITLNDGRQFVYKPRSLVPEKGFYTLLHHVNRQGLGPRLYMPWVVDKGQYGWVEYCRPLSEAPPKLKAAQHAKQFGALCTLWYMVGGTDLHDENILFTDKGVVIVDCETIFEADFRCSVLEEVRIPVLQRLEPDAVEHTILGTLGLLAFVSDLDGAQEKVRHIGGVVGFKKLLQKQEKRRQALPNKSLEWEAFTDVVCHSIEATFRYFQQQPVDSVIATVMGCFPSNTSSRLLLRNTNSYAALLHNLSINFEAIKNPDTAHDYIDKQLDEVALPYLGGIDRRAVKRAEKTQLADFDIPYFVRELGKNRIYSVEGFEHSFGKSLDFSSLRCRLAWLQDPSFIENEMLLAKIALTPQAVTRDYAVVGSDAHYSRQYHKHGQSIYDFLSFDTKDKALRTLSALADQLQAELQSPNNTEHAFYVAAFGDGMDVCDVAPLSYALFTGWAGKFLFLGLFAHVTHQPDLARYVSQKLAYFIELGRSPQYTLKHRDRGIGAGYQSLVYTFECLRRVGILDAVKVDATLLRPNPEPNYNYDFVTGVSGDALLVSLFKDDIPAADFSEWSRQLKQSMQQLLASWDYQKDRKRIGLAHGALGSCLAASRLYELNTRDTDLKSLALSLAAAEEDLVRQRRRTNASIATESGWCYGDAGRALVYDKMARAFELPDFAEKARQLTRLEAPGLHFANHTLCCGTLGYLAAHLIVRKDLPVYQDKSFRLQKFKEFYQNPRHLLKKTEQDNPGLMPTSLSYGLTGLGTVLLYCLWPDIVPAIWVIE